MLELLGKKVGMTHMYKANGSSVAITMIKIYDNKVVEFKSEELQNRALLAYNKAESKKNINKSVIGFYAKKGMEIYKKLSLSKLKTTTQFNIGDKLTIDKLLKEGDKVSVRGLTIGKGFAGVMKRWNFRGLEASHGVSVSHRSHGSTGQRQDPGKTFKGKKMAGHMGVENVTIKNLQIEYIDNEKSVIAVRGSVPGKSGSELVIKLNNF